MFSRRRFLQTSSVVSLSPWLPCVFGNTARAATAEADTKVLVVVQLDGGNDGINTVVPFGDDAYGRARNKLRLDTKKLHPLNDHVALHPNMRAAKELYEDGRLAIVQGVGYPNPDRSHFRSMKIWQTAHFDDAKHDGYGWLGRALDQQQTQRKSDAMAKAVFVGEQETPMALWSRRSSATALSRAEDLRLQAGLPSGSTAFGSPSEGPPLQQFVTSQVASAYAAAAEFERRQASSAPGSSSSYPNTKLASRLKLVSQLLKSNSQTRIFYTAQSGYDTHSTQLYTHSRLLREFSDALKAFIDDLRQAKLDDRVVVLAFSEFGRRVKENGSQGTDHGTAGPVFLAGSSVQGALIGNAPNLADLDQGDLKMQFDFRQIYATLLEDWLEIAPKPVLGAPFDRLPLLST